MRTFVVLGAVLLAGVTGVVGDAPYVGTPVGDGTTNALSCDGFVGPYKFSRANKMMDDGTCTMEEVTAEGPIAPLTSEMHHVIRGPFKLKKFAVYQRPSSSNKKRSTHLNTHRRRHGHQKFHERNNEAHEAKEELEKRYKVTAIIDGKEVSWDQNYGEPGQAGGPGASAVSASPSPEAPAPAAAGAGNGEDSEPKGDDSPTSAPTISVGNGDWARVANFDSAKKTAEGLVFTANNNFVMKSMTEAIGNVPGFVASDGVEKSSTSQILGDITIPDNYEVIISSDKSCDDGACPGAVAPGAVAFHGWGGNKIVMAEFLMPNSQCGSSCTNKYVQMNNYQDQPAWWSLATSVINSLQYGEGGCNGWKSGAGELDIHEVLVSPNPPDVGYTSFHMGLKNYAATASKGFTRPSGDKSLKMAVIIDDSVPTVRIQTLGDDIEFKDSFTSQQVEALAKSGSSIGSNKGAFVNSFPFNVSSTREGNLANAG